MQGEAQAESNGGLLRPTRWVKHLLDHLELAREGVDPEGVHQVRVAGRRLRVFLLLGSRRGLDDDLRWLVRALGRARDLDVLCELSVGQLAAAPHAPPDDALAVAQLPDTRSSAFAQWLHAQRAAAKAEAAEVLSSFRVDGLRHALELLPPVEERVARSKLSALTGDIGKLSARWLAVRLAPHDALTGLDELHRLRRALRRVRYGLEWLGERDPVLPVLQDLFGTVCDVAAMLRLVDAWSAETKLAAPGSRDALVTAVGAMMERAWLEWTASGMTARW